MCLPGDATYPSFSELGCVEHIDRVLENVVEADRNALRLLLGVLWLLPPAVHRWLLVRAGKSFDADGLLAPILRQIDYGISGLVKSLYFSGWAGSEYVGPTPDQLMGFSFGGSQEET